MKCRSRTHRLALLSCLVLASHAVSCGTSEAEDVRNVKDPSAAPKRPWEAWSPKQIEAFNKVAGPTMIELGLV